MARAAETAVDPQTIAMALAKAVADGDIVTFRAVFQPWSPARGSETERFGTPKYAYLEPTEEEQAHGPFREALRAVEQTDTWAHIQAELSAERPPRLPAGLLLQLADRAVALGKFGSAAQTYELLRIRARMQALFIEEAGMALEQGKADRAARGWRIAAALEYDYAAFPEPLPKTPGWQKQALILHGDYPDSPEKSVPMLEIAPFLRTAFSYLLDSTELAARIEPHPQESQAVLLDNLVRQIDPHWEAFAMRFQEAAAAMDKWAGQMEATRRQDDAADWGGAAAVAADFEEPAALLLGGRIPKGEWWQYLKELAYAHPPAALFVSRQLVPGGEVLVPRCRLDSPVAAALGLARKKA